MSARKQIADYEAERRRYMPIVEAAKAWRAAGIGINEPGRRYALIAAIDAACISPAKSEAGR